MADDLLLLFSNRTREDIIRGDSSHKAEGDRKRKEKKHIEKVHWVITIAITIKGLAPLKTLIYIASKIQLK